MANTKNMLEDKKYVKKLGHIRTYVKNLWSEDKFLPVYFTLHNNTHSERVEESIYQLIPSDKYSLLSEEEKFYLLASAWLHDIGMFPTLFGKKEDTEKVRNTHHIRSMDYIHENRRLLGLDDDEANIIAEICKYHRKCENIMECAEYDGDVRLRLLVAYLRLADAIHIDITRVDKSLFKIYLETGMPWESKIHWLKSFWVKSVTPDIEKSKIIIHLRISKNDAENVEIIGNIIEDELRMELSLIRDILIRGGITYFLDIETKYGLGIKTKNKRMDLQQVINNFQLERKPSASDVVSISTDTILQILALPDTSKAYSTLKEYQNQITQNVVNNRPCHVVVAKINNFIINNTKKDIEHLSDQEIKRKIIKIKTTIQRFKKKRSERIEKLINYTKAILSDQGSILLFGYSKSVINSLDKLGHEVKKETTIYVCECGNRTQYNDMNELLYCDGIEYASRIKELGYEKINIVPDILIGNLMSRDLISKVVFGTNGVDIKSGEIGHTGGHLSIAALAFLYKIPVYVIADSYKFGKMSHNKKLERKISWLPGDIKMKTKLDKIIIFNPREDVVPADKLYALVTDHGIFPPNRIPEVIKGWDIQ